MFSGKIQRFVSATGVALVLSVSLSAASVVRGPYLQLGTPSSMTIMWRTDSSVNSKVQYGLSPGNLNQFKQSLTNATDHELTIDSLQAETKYYYSVGTTSDVLAGGDASHYFVTSPPAGTPRPTRIWVLGDSGTADDRPKAVRDAFYNYTGSLNPHLLMMLGDNAYDDGTDTEYQEAVFDVYPATLRNTPTWSTLGNHDGHTADSASQSGPYYDVFTLPTAGEAGGGASGTDAYYSFDYGNIHFICLESYETDRSPSGAMLTWASNDIGMTTQEWIIAFWHHPPYSKGSHNSDSAGEDRMIDMRENALPILESMGVDLVLTGHSHAYERSFLLDGHYGFSTTLTAAMKKDDGDGREDGDGAYEKLLGFGEPNEGAVYAVAGSSGKVSSNGNLNHPAMFISVREMGSMILDVYGNRLDATFLDSTGTVEDYFTLTKGLDTLAPMIFHTEAVDAVTVSVKFAEPVIQAGAENVSNYAVDKGVAVTGAVLQGDGRTVHLTTDPLSPGVTFLLTVNNILDLAANAIAADSQDSFLYEEIFTVRFQDGLHPSPSYLGTRDTYISENNVNSNYGTSGVLLADGSDPSGLDKRTLLYWDLATQLPPNAVIQAASITIDATNPGGVYRIYDVLQPWEEDEATWNIYATSSSWETAGVDGSTDRGSDVLGVVSTSGTGSLTVQLNAAGVAVVQGWVDGSQANRGLLVADDSSTNGLDFLSREDATPSSRPLLRVDYSSICEDSFQLAAGEWKQISLACDPGAAASLEAVFGDDLSGTYKTDWAVFRREHHATDPGLDHHVAVELGEDLEVGEGYWIKTLLASQVAGSEGVYNVPVEVELAQGAAGRYSLVGHPFEYEVCWSDVEVIKGAATLTLDQADAQGVISRIGYKWTGASYAAFNGQTPGLEGTLVPFDGFWVKAYEAQPLEIVSLRIPAGGNCGAPAETLSESVALRKGKKKKERADWFVRLIAESGSLSDEHNVLGQLADSVEGLDSHDLPELAAFSAPYLSIVFPQDDWGSESGDYTSDFHSLNKKAKDSWYFEVASSEIGETVTLRWEADEVHLKRTFLLDAATGKRFKVKPGGSYSFTVESEREGFYWLVK